MQVDSEDRYIEEAGSTGFPKLPIALAVLALVIGIAWYFSGGQTESETDSQELSTPVPAQTPPPLVPPPVSLPVVDPSGNSGLGVNGTLPSAGN